ncbi:MAG TPA: hypothetical protein DCP96_06250 [Lachnospiraceae bacterium]|jgi:cell division septum initiation protein DivIVA|nr:hypothetical protein [Lachnospiraceae bacterium]MEE3356592.1 hypothetical protein [Lachnospiraceae bacterium]HAN51290.1 hypothetical protein [Lachnospiraceae bacterium]HBE08454.1 hypothetical protein [Lachnospiraceae bacterium]
MTETFEEKTEAEKLCDDAKSGEDQLLIQIDAFRDKAMQLTKLINARERKVKELEALVRAKEEKNRELQDTLARKQEEADSLVLDVNRKVDEMMTQVKDTMGNLEERIADQVAGNEESVAQQNQAVQETLTGMRENLGGVSDGLNSIKDELSEKVHSENVKVYRNIQDLLTEMNTKEADRVATEKQFHSLKTMGVFSMLFGLLNLGAVVVIVLFLAGII